jgi:hypothetical protein
MLSAQIPVQVMHYTRFVDQTFRGIHWSQLRIQHNPGPRSPWSDILKTKFIFFLVRLLLTIGTEITLISSEHPQRTNFQVNIHVCYALETVQSMCVLQLFYHPSYPWHNWSQSLWCGICSILYSQKKQLFASFISSFLLIYIQVIITTFK